MPETTIRTAVSDTDLSGLQGLKLLLSVMAQLRDPKAGCPWDLEQTHASLARYTLEEAYEVVEAIEANDMGHVSEELGDLLLQIVFHAQMASESGHFTFDDVARLEAEKMIERHPHVFGESKADTAQDVLTTWEANKDKKRADKAQSENRTRSVLDEVNTALPAISRALKLQQRAARVGFDWDNPADIIGKIHEEADELKAEIEGDVGKNPEPIEDELGDLLFALVNLARFLDIDPERALRRTNQKFERRFRYIETNLAARGSSVHDATLEEMEALWGQAKRGEKP